MPMGYKPHLQERVFCLVVLLIGNSVESAHNMAMTSVIFPLAWMVKNFWRGTGIGSVVAWSRSLPIANYWPTGWRKSPLKLRRYEHSHGHRHQRGAEGDATDVGGGGGVTAAAR